MKKHKLIRYKGVPMLYNFYWTLHSRYSRDGLYNIFAQSKGRIYESYGINAFGHVGFYVVTSELGTYEET